MANQLYFDRSVVSLSAGQAAGTAAVLAANPNRAGLILHNPGANQMNVGISSAAPDSVYPLAATSGLKLAAGETACLGQGSPCPSNALYVFGTAGDKLTIWEA